MDNRGAARVVGGVAVSATVLAGIGATAAILWSKHLSSVRREYQQLISTLENLSEEVRALRKEVAELKGQRKAPELRSPPKPRPRPRNAEEFGGGDTGSSTALREDGYRRGASYQSLTSDAEYADAEEEWEEESVNFPSMERPLSPISFAEIDQYFGVENVRPGYDILKKRYECGDKSSELLWRLARFCHELSCRCTDKTKKKELIFEGKRYGLEAHQADENDFEALKWAAIMTGQSTDYLGTKERIEEGGKFKDLLDKALAVDAKEFSLLHLRGRYAYSVAGLSWIERKAAAVFYSTPPTATFEEALDDFLAAYEVKPDWIENLIYIARIYYNKGDKANAKKYLNKLLAIKPNDEAEREYQQEAKKLLSKC